MYYNNSHLFRDLPPSDTDGEMSVAIATKFSCLPSNTTLSVTMPERNIVRINHPVAHPLPLLFGCVLVKGIVFVYMEPIATFLPLWAVLQHFVLQWDNMFWYFEMTKEEQELADLVLSNPTLPGSQGGSSRAREDGTFAPSFDLRIQSSSRNYRLAMPTSSVANQRRRDSAATLDEGAHVTLPSQPFSSVNVSRARAAAVAESTVVRRRQMTAAPMAADDEPPTSSAAADEERDASTDTRRVSDAQLPLSTCTPTATIRSTVSNQSYRGSSSCGRTEGRLDIASTFHEEMLTCQMDGMGLVQDDSSAFSTERRRVVNFSASIVNETGPAD
ncbi:hypothetical protein STCU_12231 [Strigomonas culicis]|uniref:Uncharacterized protein n=1 Tax=Strigomonas culicis TaxID=28005 RepID=S9TE34_9TRYP|nr:hypothetical protein STCU_12231 [Strigomonas culicis]|eukprot:EPY15219.1 hypothetical protein STCU_12231 [Strigomonas culicis]